MFKVVYQGLDIHCDTADEVIEITNKLAGLPASRNGHRTPQGKATADGSRWTPSRFQNLHSQLRSSQRRFLREVLNSTDPVTDATLRHTLGLASNKAFGPILTGISRKAKRVGVSLRDIVIRDKIG